MVALTDPVAEAASLHVALRAQHRQRTAAETAATNVRPGGSNCAYSRLVRRERRSTRSAPPLCKQWPPHSIRANPSGDLSRAQFVPITGLYHLEGVPVTVCAVATVAWEGSPGVAVFG
jgi:hypothetical protein